MACQFMISMELLEEYSLLTSAFTKSTRHVQFQFVTRPFRTASDGHAKHELRVQTFEDWRVAEARRCGHRADQNPSAG